jgi:uncharacterized protein (TIGR02466 family)
MRAGLQMLLLFATPLMVFDVPDAASLNVELRRVIAARERSHPTTHHSNQGGWQSSWDMDRWGGAPAVKLLSFGRNVANEVTTDREGNAGHGAYPGHATLTWHANMWANVNRSGNANELHWHRGSYWSGVYYVEDGGIDANPTLGGELEFVDPRGAIPTMLAPHLDVAKPASLSAKHRIRPKPGLMVMFPSWMMHQVRPYRGNAERISIAFNLTL